MRTSFAVEPELTIPSAPAAVRDYGEQSTEHGVSGGRILYAEDNDDVREITAASLRRAGYNVVAVANGRSAWEELHRNDFDLLITDNDMPGLTGLELIVKIRREGMALTVILASGAGGALRGPVLEQLRLNARLQKPFTRDELLNAVKSALRDAREIERPLPSENRVFLMQGI